MKRLVLLEFSNGTLPLGQYLFRNFLRNTSWINMWTSTDILCWKRKPWHSWNLVGVEL